MRDVWAGADLGSTNTKVVLVDDAGRVLTRAAQPTPRDSRGYSDADALVDALEELLLSAIHTLGDARLRGVCVAGVGEDGVLHASGRPLGPAVPWFAPERLSTLDRLRELSHDDDRSRYGVRLDAARTVAAWALLNLADVARATGWVACTDYPALRWTSRAVMSASLAPRTGAWLLGPSSWDPARVTPFLPLALMPEVVAAGTVIGALRSQRLSAAGVLADHPVVVAGGHDHPVGAAVVHRQDPGSVLDSMGTAEVIVRTLDPPYPCDVDLSPAILGDGRTAQSVIELDRNMSWLRKSNPGNVVDAVLDGTLTAILGDGDVFVPGAEGGAEPHWTAAAARLTDGERITAAVLELAAAGAATLHRLAPAATTVYAAGGWTRAPGWMRLKATAAQLPYRVLQEPELTALGAAQLCLGDRPLVPVIDRTIQ